MIKRCPSFLKLNAALLPNQIGYINNVILAQIRPSRYSLVEKAEAIRSCAELLIEGLLCFLRRSLFHDKPSILELSSQFVIFSNFKQVFF